jgi:hypothetical protein
LQKKYEKGISETGIENPQDETDENDLSERGTDETPKASR